VTENVYQGLQFLISLYNPLAWRDKNHGQPKERDFSTETRKLKEGTTLDLKMVKTRIVIADDQALFRSGLRKLLETKAHLKVVGESDSRIKIAALVRKLHPDILLLDVRPPRLSGELQRLSASSDTRVILLTASIDTNDVVQALKCGVRGILLKNSPTQSVFSGIDIVMAGQYWIYGNGASDLAGALNRLSECDPVTKIQRGKFNLTRRELDVIQAIASGCANKEIAQQLSISEQTVKHHVRNIFNKTGSSSRLELTLFAIEKEIFNLQSPSAKVGKWRAFTS
jgi:two-component system nitrate/nitrite response regulator NarL